MFVVLTIPDVRAEHEHARRLLAQRLRAWQFDGKSLEAWWGKEYQRRGAVHYNLFVVVPKGFEAVFTAKLRRYLTRCQRWGRYTCEPMRRGGRGAVAYALKYGVKEGENYQHKLPTGVEGAGRWWGVVGTRAGWCRRSISEAEFHNLNRCRRSWLRSRGVRVDTSRERRSVVQTNGPPNLAEVVGV